MTTPEVDLFAREFPRFEAERMGVDPPWLVRVRQDAMQRFLELGLPTPQDEDWPYTNLGPWMQAGFRATGSAAGPPPRRADLERFLLFEPSAPRLVFVDGRHVPELSVLPPLPAGVCVQPLRAALAEASEELRECLSRRLGAETRAFTALNAAYFSEGAFVHLGAGAALERPIHLLFLSTPTAAPAAFHPRAVIRAERGSRAQLVETYAGLDGGPSFSNAVSQLQAGPDSVVEHYRVQEEGSAAVHVGLLDVRLDRGSRCTSHVVTLGAALARTEVRVAFGAAGAACKLYGLYWISGRQHADHLTAVDHAVPHCASEQVYRGILDERARGVFFGRVQVRPGARGTDAHQSNRNLLLSEEATADAKPQLDIQADDVRCTHGVAIGQLDRAALFYLRSRGIPLAAARGMLTRAFAGAVTEYIRVPALRCRLDRMLALGLPDEREPAAAAREDPA